MKGKGLILEQREGLANGRRIFNYAKSAVLGNLLMFPRDCDLLISRMQEGEYPRPLLTLKAEIRAYYDSLCCADMKEELRGAEFAEFELAAASE